MYVDKWFDEQDRLIRILLLLIPFIGWLVEVLVRISVTIRKPETINIAGCIVFAVGGWIFQFVDLIFFIITDHMLILSK